VATIQNALRCESEFNLKTMNYFLDHARCYAAAGDRSMMEWAMKEASKHAKLVGANDSKFMAKLASIRNTLGSQSEFHLRKMNYFLDEARSFSVDGNRSMMKWALKEATKHAKLAGAFDKSFISKLETIIRDGSTGIKIESYFRSQSDV